MCISIPARIISICDRQAEVEVQGRRQSVFLSIEAQTGQWVLLYAGTALAVIADDEALEMNSLLERMRGAD